MRGRRAERDEARHEEAARRNERDEGSAAELFSWRVLAHCEWSEGQRTHDLRLLLAAVLRVWIDAPITARLALDAWLSHHHTAERDPLASIRALTSPESRPSFSPSASPSALTSVGTSPGATTEVERRAERYSERSPLADVLRTSQSVPTLQRDAGSCHWVGKPALVTALAMPTARAAPSTAARTSPAAASSATALASASPSRIPVMRPPSAPSTPSGGRESLLGIARRVARRPGL